MAVYRNLIITSANPRELGSGDAIHSPSILTSGLLVLKGAAAYGALVSGANAFLAADSGAVLSGTSVTGGGLLRVTAPSGIVLSTTISGSGFFWLNGGSASDTKLYGKCIETLSGGATEIGTFIGADATQQILNATVSGTVVSGSGAIVLYPDRTQRSSATSAALFARRASRRRRAAITTP